MTAPVGKTYQYSTVNYAVLGLIVQTVAGRSYESYVQTEILDPLQMRGSFTSAAAAEHHGLATGYRYWFGRPRAADLPYNRGLVPAGYLISDAEDMSHYLIAQLNHGRYGSASVLSPEGVDELHRPAVQTPETGTSYGMGWFVGPINGIPAIHHQGETFNFHANAVLVPGSRTGVIVLMNAENSIDLFLTGRMGTISEGVTSLLEGRDPAPPPSSDRHVRSSTWCSSGSSFSRCAASCAGSGSASRASPPSDTSCHVLHLYWFGSVLLQMCAQFEVCRESSARFRSRLRAFSVPIKSERKLSFMF